MSFVLYALFSLLIGIIICILLISMVDKYRINLNYKYENMSTRYDIPENGSFTAAYSNDQTKYTIFDTKGNEICKFNVDYQKERPVHEYVYPNHVSYIEVSPNFTNRDYPAENFAAAGVDLEAGQEIYISTTEKNVIYLKYDSGYARFERSPEDAAAEEQDETEVAEKENEIEGNSEMADNMDDAMAENYGEYGFGEDGEFDFDSILGIDQLDLNYEAHVAGFDGESFLYSVYFDGGVTDEKAEEIQQVM